MNVVGKVGSLITQGVYSVATPFHPFGGAVDIIVVEQEDGTYRSTPWYVRFGKFQGVLKGAEKVVGISVNGIESDFHMFLDNSGEAYFVREVESGNEDAESRVQADHGSHLPDSSGDVDDISNQESNTECTQIEENNEQSYGFSDEFSSQQNSTGSPEYTTYHYGSLDEEEDLMKSSQDSNSEMVLVSVDGHVLTAPISSAEGNMENLQLSMPQFHLGPGKGSEEFASGRDQWPTGLFGDLDAAPDSRDTSGCPLEESNEAMGHLEFDQEAHGIGGDMSDRNGSSENISLGMKGNDMFMSCLELSELTFHLEESNSQNLGTPSMTINAKDGSESSPSRPPPPKEDREASADHHFVNGACALPLSSNLTLVKELQTMNTEIEESTNDVVVDVSTENVGFEAVCTVYSGYDSPVSDGSLAINTKMDDYEEKTLVVESSDSAGSVDISSVSINFGMEQKDDAAESNQVISVTEIECSKAETSGAPSLGFEISLCGNFLRPGMGRNSADEAFEAHRISKEEFEASGPTIVMDRNLIVRFKGKYLPWDKAVPIVLGTAVFGSDVLIDLNYAISVEEATGPQTREDTNAITPSPSRRWRLWSIPFRRTKSLQHTNSSCSDKEVFVDSESCLQSPDAESPTPSHVDGNRSPHKQFLRTNIPTTEQIASLKLKDGQNIIAFNFVTRVWGKQKVDAHIYLWKWNARIVISDVDGTITKSDVLGQFMPLVGRDWTQSGVARLFSAIKENGYQLLFLSARAIVQAYLTRSFLLNLKQDGKALPNGPVVISPDGLFPSLYREVIRRAPHEFKIACLEDIRALFPSDYNPFYAGFGNRDTDELSYRKIGIPKGKIFIINPKGEVAINHSVDVKKSYTSLHMLVNDMFPPTSVAEQEDFNSWNYWKMPLPSIDC